MRCGLLRVPWRCGRWVATQALQQTAGQDSFPGLQALRCPAHCEAPVSDAEFDAWAAPAFEAAVRFLRGRPPGALATISSLGVYLRVCICVEEVGPSYVDWPDELYAACRECGVGFVTIYPPGER